MGLRVPAAKISEYNPPAIETCSGMWYVLHTRARNEKATSSDLSRLGIQNFLPLIRYRRLYGGKRRRVEIPLFPGYLFMCGSRADREAALRTNRIAQILDVADQNGLRTDLQHIHQVVTSEETVDFYPRLKRGVRCRVVSGTLQGLEGVVIRRKGPWRVFVGVAFLGQSAELEIDPTFLSIIEE